MGVGLCTLLANAQENRRKDGIRLPEGKGLVAQHPSPLAIPGCINRPVGIHRAGGVVCILASNGEVVGPVVVSQIGTG